MRIVLAILLVLATPALADTREVTDHAGRTVTIPADPQRIAALGAKNVAVPLIELGIVPVASQGSVLPDGTELMRASKVTTGIDFDNSGISFLGNFPIDIEAVALADPDLIILPDWQDEVSLDQLEAIAPTIVYATDTPLHEAQAFFAEITGTGARLRHNRIRYDAQVAQIRALVPEGTTVSYLHAFDGALFSWHEYFHIGALLRDAGLAFPDIIETIPDGEHARFSAERLQDFDADWLFITYRTDQAQTPADAVAAMETVLPSWCEVLTACREGRVVYLPRAEVSTPSYDAAMAVAFAIVSHLSDPARQPTD
ncbi:ABC transporter substrate-binding protein [Aestuariibius sp. 2305UL40-4]|uniref:ABC transporter substrate-binding protein n=1 Tax=Aestuariibius violaceus TaxID=3234132 RepID=UPI00345E5443